jgi:hypothetical protein
MKSWTLQELQQVDTEMSSCIFSGSKGKSLRNVWTLEKPGFKAVGCREAVGVQEG